MLAPLMQELLVELFLLLRLLQLLQLPDVHQRCLQLAALQVVQALMSLPARLRLVLTCSALPAQKAKRSVLLAVAQAALKSMALALVLARLVSVQAEGFARRVQGVFASWVWPVKSTMHLRPATPCQR